MTEHTFPHLSAVLNAGRLPTDDDTTEILVTEVVTIALGDPNRRASFIETYLDHPDLPEPERRAQSYAVDLLRSPELVPAVLAALGPDAAADAWWRIDCERQPYPLFVGPRKLGERPGIRWQCCNCGDFHDNDDHAVVITGRAGYSDDLECPITYCAACIRSAADALPTEA